MSYFVGCVFGRYSLDYEKVIDNVDNIFRRDYEKILPRKDNVLIISTEEYFKNDIYNLFLKFFRNCI